MHEHKKSIGRALLSTYARIMQGLFTGLSYKNFSYFCFILYVWEFRTFSPDTFISQAKKLNRGTKKALKNEGNNNLFFFGVIFHAAVLQSRTPK